MIIGKKDNRNYHMLYVHCKPHVLFKSNLWSSILSDMWQGLTVLAKKLTDMTNLIDGNRDIWPNWDVL